MLYGAGGGHNKGPSSHPTPRAGRLGHSRLRGAESVPAASASPPAQAVLSQPASDEQLGAGAENGAQPPKGHGLTTSKPPGSPLCRTPPPKALQWQSYTCAAGIDTIYEDHIFLLSLLFGKSRR